MCEAVVIAHFMKPSPSLETRLIPHVDVYQLEKRLLRLELLDPPILY